MRAVVAAWVKAGQEKQQRGEAPELTDDEKSRIKAEVLAREKSRGGMKKGFL